MLTASNAIMSNIAKPQASACILRPALRSVSKQHARTACTGVSSSASPRVVVAIDGPAASGKGTLAKRIAAIYNLAHLDTGLLYRGVGYKALTAGVSLSDEESLGQIANLLQASELMGNLALRGDAAAAAASQVSVFPKVRAALLQYQRNFAENPPSQFQGAVLDGRDIGTAICPNANLKLFITASAEKRAVRRVEDLRARGLPASYEQVLAELVERDARDTGRRTDPLAAASDAIQLDTSDLDIEAVVATARAHLERVCPNLRAVQVA